METTKPNSKKGNVIRGIPVEFPYEPYGSQLGFMNRVISTLDRAHAEGHCHALLESPTGTGKSLSLLCSSLAWQKNFKAKNLYANLSHSKPAPEAVSDPFGHGGGFIPETQTQRTSAHGDAETGTPAANGKNPKKKSCPTIFYATRTHSQISQVIREYRKTAYRVPMAVLASRKHYCTNKNVQGRTNLDEECKMLLKDQDMGCSEYKNMHKVKGHPTIQKGGCYEAHDIEDLVKIGQTVKGCPYYAARSMADNAQLVFCPYSYIINPVIRGAMEVDIKGAIVIFDEAHNIEDIARDAGSVDLEEDVLDKLQVELLRLCGSDRGVYQPLFEMTRDITDWMRRKKKTLEKREFQHYFSCWTGHNALRELREAADISPLRFLVLLECARKAIKAATDMESDGYHLNGMCVLTLEGLFSSLSYFFSGNGLHIHDYQLALQRYMKREAGNATGNWTYTMSLWCLNPAVVFKEIADLSLSVILTSGTLSPVNSFSSELGVQFGTCLEAQHVVDVDSRLWAAVISRGPANHQLNASYKTSDVYAFQDALGKSIEEICKIVPGGALIFFPSYKFMEKMRTRWCETGQWSRLDAQKPLFVEPRGGTQDDFEPILKSYYDAIQCGSKLTFGRKKKGKKLDWNDPHKDSNESSNKGAAFLAVCRGKVSEGIDFSDENARLVIVVGIPFPNINDIQVAQKKKYNDAYKSSKNLISGNEWYCYQAFRALNQAAGRCLRHRYDYGAIILLDERFQEERNTAYISKWLKKSIRQYDNFEKSLEGLKSFFNNAKEQFDRKPMNDVPEPDNHVKEYFYKNQKKENARTKNQKLNNFGPSGLDVSNKIPARKAALLSHSFTYSSKYEGTSPVSLQQQSHGNGKSQPIKDVKDVYSCRVYTDLDCSPQRASRCCKAASVVSSDGSPDASIVRETADINDFMSPGSSCKDENSSTTFGGASPQIQNRFNQPSGVSPTANCSLVVTPSKVVDGGTCHFEPDTEASLNSSVNSYAQKRRKFIRSSLLDQVHDSDAVGIEAPGHVYSTGSIMTKDASHSIEFGAGALQKCEEENGCQSVLQNDDCISSGPAPEVLRSFSYKLQQNSSGWRSTRSKLRLPRRAVLTDLDA